MDTRDGGPAFPVTRQEWQDGQLVPMTKNGMFLRDYFAGQALAGLVVGCAGMLGDEFSAYAKGHCNHALACRAYVMADAMLAERAKERV